VNLNNIFNKKHPSKDECFLFGCTAGELKEPKILKALENL
jgi:hypothetical protein